MDRKRLFKITSYLIIILFLVNYVAVKLYWYSSIWYFDMPMHFVGGLCVGLAFIWLLSFPAFSKSLSLEISLNLIIKIFVGVLLVGILWEIFEVLVNNVFAQMPFNTLDTISDVFFDLAGGTFAIFYFFKKNMRVMINKV